MYWGGSCRKFSRGSNSNRRCRMDLTSRKGWWWRRRRDRWWRTNSTWSKSVRGSRKTTSRLKSGSWKRRWCGRSWTWSAMSWLSTWRKGIKLSKTTNKGWPSLRLTLPKHSTSWTAVSKRMTSKLRSRVRLGSCSRFSIKRRRRRKGQRLKRLRRLNVEIIYEE
jgi:hypothetical protein